jgi:GDPmannose 4,6-dehydratase
MSHVKVSFEMPEYSANSDGMGTLRLLNAIRTAGLSKKTRFYQASSNALYGNPEDNKPQSETTPFYPRSPYGVAKQFAYWIVVNYREAYNIHATNGILFNHESPRRGPTFVTRKITRAAARIKFRDQECLFLGNLDAKRDWGHAADYVKVMWMMLQQEKAEDFVIASGETHTVREFVEKAFGYVGLDIMWRGERGSVQEVGYHRLEPERVLVRVDPRYFRPTEVNCLVGDPAKARRVLGWKPAVSFDQLVQEMVDADVQEFLASRDRVLFDVHPLFMPKAVGGDAQQRHSRQRPEADAANRESNEKLGKAVVGMDRRLLAVENDMKDIKGLLEQLLAAQTTKTAGVSVHEEPDSPDEYLTSRGNEGMAGMGVRTGSKGEWGASFA